ncbi:hypothetical protein LTR66_002691 [Elasticomyces elasticus]|nr:hypothetical protein LTR66_002691 [Elasticomyces elasticus]
MSEQNKVEASNDTPESSKENTRICLCTPGSAAKSKPPDCSAGIDTDDHWHCKLNRCHMTVAGLMTKFAKRRTFFFAGGFVARLQYIISISIDLAKVKITNAVCLALGSMSVTWHETFMSDNSMFQLLLFLTIVDYLERETGQEINRFAQDPAFTDTDEKFLEANGITVLRRPQAERAITPTTFLYTPYGQLNVVLPLFQYKPAVYVGHDIASVIETYQSKGPSWLEDVAAEVHWAEENWPLYNAGLLPSYVLSENKILPIKFHMAWKIENSAKEVEGKEDVEGQEETEAEEKREAEETR